MESAYITFAYELLLNIQLQDARRSWATNPDYISSPVSRGTGGIMNGVPCDVTIKCSDDKEFFVHRAKLAAISPFLNRMFTYGSSGMSPSTSSTANKEAAFDLHDITGDVFELILDYAYTHTCHVNNENVEVLLPAANFLQVEMVMQFCCNLLIHQLTPSNCLGVYRYTSRSCERILRRYICENFKEITVDREDSEFKSLTADELEPFLRDDNLQCNSEKQVFESLRVWIEHNRETRRSLLPRLLKSIRFHLIKTNYFQERIVPWCLEVNPECQDYLMEIARQLETREDVGSVYWTELEEQVPNCRRPHEALFISGGYQGYIPYEVLCYNIRRNEWRSQLDGTAPLCSCSNHGMCEVDKLIYIYGGRRDTMCLNCLYSLNPANKRCQRLPNMLESRAFLSSCAHAGKAYALGGIDDKEKVLNSCERYNPATKQWERLAPMNFGRAHASATSFNNKIYIVGGFEGRVSKSPNLPGSFFGGTCLSSCEVYDSDTNQWTFFLPLEKPRAGLALVSYRNFLYILGGYEAHELPALRTVERYNPEQPDRWHPVTPMQIARSDFCAAVYDDMIFAVGGYDGGVIGSVECYDADSSRWYNAEKLPMMRRGLGACVIEGLDYECDFFR